MTKLERRDIRHAGLSLFDRTPVKAVWFRRPAGRLDLHTRRGGRAESQPRPPCLGGMQKKEPVTAMAAGGMKRALR